MKIITPASFFGSIFLFLFGCGTSDPEKKTVSKIDSTRLTRNDSFLFVNRFGQRCRVVNAENLRHDKFYLVADDTFRRQASTPANTGRFTDVYSRTLEVSSKALNTLLELFNDSNLFAPLDCHPYDSAAYAQLIRGPLPAAGILRLRYDTAHALCPFVVFDVQLDQDIAKERVVETSFGDMLWEHHYDVLDNSSKGLQPVKQLVTTSRNWMPDSIQTNPAAQILWLKQFSWGTCYSCVSWTGYRLDKGNLRRVIRPVPLAAYECSLSPMFGNDPGELDVGSDLETADTSRVHFRIYFQAKRYAENADGCEVLNDSTLLLRLNWNSDSLCYLPEQNTPLALRQPDGYFEPADLMPLYNSKLRAAGAYRRKHWQNCKSF